MTNPKRKFRLSNAFKRDLKKHHLALIGEAWTEISDCLLNAKTIPPKYQDHSLSGNWDTFRDCHVQPDLVLIYKIIHENQTEIVELHRLNSHSEIFG